jgi:hypothetical protein
VLDPGLRGRRIVTDVRTVSTTDLQYAAYLMVLGGIFQRMEGDNFPVQFVVSIAGHSEAEDAYYSGRAMVEPRAYYHATRQLKFMASERLRAVESSRAA